MRSRSASRRICSMLSVCRTRPTGRDERRETIQNVHSYGGFPRMRAVVLRSYGPPSVLGVEEVQRPELKPGHVRLRVHAVGFGFPDALTVAGKYQVKPEVPFTPGSETAGVVTEVAADVTSVKPGARVLAMTGQGGLAEECIAPAANLISLPASMSMAAAAGFLVNYG